MNPSINDRSYGGEPAAERIRRRRASLLDVALTAMAEDRWRSATVAGICAEAGLNKRYFYESFPDLDALSSGVIDEIAEEVGGAAVATYLASLDRPLDEQARAAVDAVVGVLGTDRRKARVFLGGTAGAPIAHARRDDAIRGLTGILVDHARAIHDVELEADSLASTGPAFVIGGTAHTILAWAEGTIDITRRQLVEDITDLWLALGAKAADIADARRSAPDAGRASQQ
ncbi:TetR/AcrR family transcriptional regulator [Rhodococcus triatomae]|nr:Transcriptional regulator [Rhodococcus triatomae BKS 15-14]